MSRYALRQAADRCWKLTLSRVDTHVHLSDQLRYAHVYELRTGCGVSESGQPLRSVHHRNYPRRLARDRTTLSETVRQVGVHFVLAAREIGKEQFKGLRGLIAL